ncbi:hypothetical protein [Propioniciclava flava]
MPQPVTHVSSHLEAEVTAVAEIVLSVAVAYGVEEETLTVSVDGSPVAVEEVLAPHGTRLHVLRDVPVGALVVMTTGPPSLRGMVLRRSRPRRTPQTRWSASPICAPAVTPSRTRSVPSRWPSSTGLPGRRCWTR